MKHLFLTGLLFFTDFLTKNKVEKKGVPKLPKKLEKPFGRHIGFTKVHNEGFMLHTLDKKKSLVKGISDICATVFLFFAGNELFGKSNGKFAGLSKTGMAFLASGAIGNTYDRFRRGFVVDFIQIKTFGKKFERIVFNLADFFLFIGVALYSLALILVRKR